MTSNVPIFSFLKVMCKGYIYRCFEYIKSLYRQR